MRAATLRKTDNYQYSCPEAGQSSKKMGGRRIHTVFSVPAEILQKATKCRNNFSCLQTGQCGDNPMCAVETAHNEDVLCVRTADWPDCPYHMEFGGARFCVCPVRCAIHQLQTP
jgi:hypothetical protein